MRLLDRNAEISTRYGGGFVQSIDGIEGGRSDGRQLDWFFYVNGVESPVGAAEYELARRLPGLVGLPGLDGGDAGPGRGRLVPGAVPQRL